MCRRRAGKLLLLVERERLKAKHVSQQQKQLINKKIIEGKKSEPFSEGHSKSSREEEDGEDEEQEGVEEEEEEEEEGVKKEDEEEEEEECVVLVEDFHRKISSSSIPLPCPSSSILTLKKASTAATTDEAVLDTAFSKIPVLARQRSSREELLKQRKESSVGRKRGSALIICGQIDNSAVAAATCEERKKEVEEVIGTNRKSEVLEEERKVSKEEGIDDGDILQDSMNPTSSQTLTSGSRSAGFGTTATNTKAHAAEKTYIDSHYGKEEQDVLSDSLLPLKGLQSHLDNFGEMIDALHTEAETSDSPDIEFLCGKHPLLLTSRGNERNINILADSLTLPYSDGGSAHNKKLPSLLINTDSAVSSTLNSNSNRNSSTSKNVSCDIKVCDISTKEDDSVSDRGVEVHKVALRNQSKLQQPKRRSDRGPVISGSGGVAGVAGTLHIFNTNSSTKDNDDSRGSVNGSCSTKSVSTDSHDYQYTDIYRGKSSSTDHVTYPNSDATIKEVDIFQRGDKEGKENDLLHKGPGASLLPSVRGLVLLTSSGTSTISESNLLGVIVDKNRRIIGERNDQRNLRNNSVLVEVVKVEKPGREKQGRNGDRRRQQETENRDEEGEETTQYLEQQKRYKEDRRKRKEERREHTMIKEEQNIQLVTAQNEIENKSERKIENKIAHRILDGRKRLDKIQVREFPKVTEKDKKREEERNRGEDRQIGEEALMAEILELEERQRRSIRELQRKTDMNHDGGNSKSSPNNDDDNYSVSQSDREGPNRPKRGPPGASGAGRSGGTISSRPEVVRERMKDKLAFGPGARDIRRVEKVFADHADVAKVSASHNAVGGAGNSGKDKEMKRDRSAVQYHERNDSDAWSERRQKRRYRERLRERDRETEGEEEKDEHVEDIGDSRYRSTDITSRDNENNYHSNRNKGRDSDVDRERERDRSRESERGRHNRATELRGIPEYKALPISNIHYSSSNRGSNSQISTDADTGEGEGYLSEYKRKNGVIRSRHSDKRYNEMDSEYHSDNDSQVSSILGRAISTGRERGNQKIAVSLPPLLPPPAMHQHTHQHPLDSSRHREREKERERRGRRSKAFSAPSRLLQGGISVHGNPAFESQSVSALPPPVRVSHDYSPSHAHALRPLQHRMGFGMGR